MYNQSPNSLSSMLCSVVSEILPSIQHTILGTICSGHNLNFAGDPGFENVFSIPDCSVEEFTNSAQIILETLRNKWPVSAASEYYSLLQRQVSIPLPCVVCTNLDYSYT